MTDDLIARLTADLRPVRHWRLPLLLASLLTAGLVAAILMLGSTLGMRPDVTAAAETPMLWLKFAYALGMAACGIWAIRRLATPDQSGFVALRLAAALVAGLLVAGSLALALGEPDRRETMLFGQSALVCPFIIMALSAPILFSALIWLRGTAPSKPALAGASAGLVAGSLGALVYVMHCTEDTIPFVAAWYSLGIVMAVLAGSLAGHRLLRW